MDSHYYLTDETGTLRFTPEGMREFAPYFARAGIDIRDIKTLHAYYQARKKASPFFTERLAERAAGWPDTDQFDLLRTATFGTPEDLEKEIERFDRKQSFNIVK